MVALFSPEAPRAKLASECGSVETKRTADILERIRPRGVALADPSRRVVV
jgi:hypothetical protein